MRKAFVEMQKLVVPQSGLGQFCLHAGRAMAAQRPARLELSFYVPRAQQGVFGGGVRYVPCSPLHRLVPPSRDGFDVWHCIHQDSRHLPPRRSTKLVLTIHDLNFLQKYTGLRQRARLRALQRKLDRADVVTFISRFTERVVREHLRLDGKPTAVIYNGNSLVAFPDAARPRFAPRGRFLFAIGIISPKKNFHVLVPFVRALAGYSLVLAGSDVSPYAREIRRLAEEQGVADRVILCGSVTDEEKYWLYANCDAFVFPSLAEGFGLPVVEAMSVGKPVFLSTHTSLPETGGEEAFYWPELEPEPMRAVFERGMDAYRADPSKGERIRRWASRFAWDEAGREYLRLYAEV